MKDHDNVTERARETEGLIFGALAILIFSLSMVGTRLAAPQLGGLFVGLARGLIAATLAALVARKSGYGLPDRADWPALAGVSLGSVLGFPVLSAVALEQVPATHALVFTAALPLFTSMIAALRAGESLPRRSWIAGFGAMLLVTMHVLRGGTSSLQGADFLLLAGMLLSALGYTEGGRLASKYGGARVLAWALLSSVPVLAPAVVLVAWWRPPHGTALAWAGLGYIGIFTMYLGFLSWYRGMAAAGIARTSQLQFVQPLLGLAWCALFLGEPLSPSLALTAFGVIVLVAAGRRPASQRPSLPAPRCGARLPLSYLPRRIAQTILTLRIT